MIQWIIIDARRLGRLMGIALLYVKTCHADRPIRLHVETAAED